MRNLLILDNKEKKVASAILLTSLLFTVYDSIVYLMSMMSIVYLSMILFMTFNEVWFVEKLKFTFNCGMSVQ